MKIAIVSPVFPPYKGGIGRAAESEAEDLTRRGHEVTVFVPYVGRSVSDHKFNLCELRPFLKYGNAAFLPQLWWKLKNFDVVHLHYPFFGGAEVIYKKTKKRKNEKTKLVITYHHDVIGRGVVGRFFRWHTKHLMPKILRTADKIIVSSFDYAKNSNTKDIFEKCPEKFVEVPFGVDVKKFYPTRKDEGLLMQYNLKPDEKIILFVGSLDKAHYFKGLEYLIRSKVKNQKSKLLVVGNGNLRSYYEQLAKKLKIQNQVIFTGTISGEDLPKYYNLAEVVVLPSIDQSEAFGIVLIEAMACGKPVIASNLPGVRSVVDYGINGFLVEPKNIRQLAEKIDSLLYNSNLLRQFSENSRQKVLEKYDMEKVGEKLEKALLNC